MSHPLIFPGGFQYLANRACPGGFETRPYGSGCCPGYPLIFRRAFPSRSRPTITVTAHGTQKQLRSPHVDHHSAPVQCYVAQSNCWQWPREVKDQAKIKIEKTPARNPFEFGKNEGIQPGNSFPHFCWWKRTPSGNPPSLWRQRQPELVSHAPVPFLGRCPTIRVQPRRSSSSLSKRGLKAFMARRHAIRRASSRANFSATSQR